MYHWVAGGDVGIVFFFFVVVVVVVVVVSYFVKDLHIIFNGYACPFLLT